MDEVERLIAYLQKKAVDQLHAGRGMTVGGDPDVGGGYTSRLEHTEQHSYAGHVLSAIVGDLRAGLHLRETTALPEMPEGEKA